MRNIIVASAFAAALALALPTAADAKTNVKIYLGVPHYSYQVGPEYLYRPNYGWYMPSGIHGRLSCGEAKWRGRSHGFHNVSTIECQGRPYTFHPKRGGHPLNG